LLRTNTLAYFRQIVDKEQSALTTLTKCVHVI